MKQFFDRDSSWLSFNERVLQEAARETVPLFERIRFLSIYSSNLDEFYRVRMPSVMNQPKTDAGKEPLYAQINRSINTQLNEYGRILNQSIITSLKNKGVVVTDFKSIPSKIIPAIRNYFFNHVAGFLQCKQLGVKDEDFFPENNQLYILATMNRNGKEDAYLINIPSGNLSRFLKLKQDETYIVFLGDVIRCNLSYLFPDAENITGYNIKITRNADFSMPEEYGDDFPERIEDQLAQRDKGFASRLLYEPGIPLRHLYHMVETFQLFRASVVEGGAYHNLKDLAQLPVDDVAESYPSWPVKKQTDDNRTLFQKISEEDLAIHTPYQSYEQVLRFFNEAAADSTVEAIYTTLYRVANESRIVHALISAARNGKQVTVLVELKARFDEANNIKWAKRMKAAGVKIIYSNNAVKVHAKVALVKRRNAQAPYLGLLATGNLNETTARFYTDHVLFTAHQPMLTELGFLFQFLKKQKRPEAADLFQLNHLLVAQFNLLQKFIGFIDREIENARKQLPASITIKLNNLEEEVLIKKLYEASNAGVTVNLIVRSICRLVPGVPQQSEHIKVKRIVDRYLEHGRVFIFNNNNKPEVFLGSADWMNRNIYHRIEVCFPVYNPVIKEQIMNIINIQWNDNVQAVWIDSNGNNISATNEQPLVRSQETIHFLLNNET
jgi:polyphosphate kinase